MKFILATILCLCLASTADAQYFGGFGGGYGGYGGYGGGMGMGYYNPMAGFNPLAYSSQLYQSQSSLTQSIFQQQQQEIIDQIRKKQAEVAQLDSVKQQMFLHYLDMSDSDKLYVKWGLVHEYLSLDSRRQAAWDHDAVIQIIIGPEIKRLGGYYQYRHLTPDNQNKFRQAMQAKYNTLPVSQKEDWHHDIIISMIMGKDWAK